MTPRSALLAGLLLGLPLAEAGLLSRGGRKAGAHARVREVPVSIPLRVPILIPLDGPFVGGPVMDDDFGPVSPEFGGLGEDMGSLGDIARFAQAFAADGGPPPSFPVPADGIRIRMRPGNGVPTPLRMSNEAGRLVISGKLPEHLNASGLKVNQFGRMLSVQYHVGEGRSMVGVEQRFMLDFEPRESARVKYSRATGEFHLDVSKPKDAARPQDIAIVFEDEPEQTKEPPAKAAATLASSAPSKASHHVAAPPNSTSKVVERKVRHDASNAAVHEAARNLKDAVKSMKEPMVLIEVDNN